MRLVGAPGRSVGPVGSPKSMLSAGLRASTPWRTASVGHAEVQPGGRLAMWITDATEAGRTARGLVADEVVDVAYWGSRPVVRLR